eukprot:CAMPEP_0202857952 /NCGR_PEP_ID=MMETSP1391-20130828/688_1 /ASSEMBLY_ACC=CAM_ASM_000867 /TAXON_ID=1034604 /ORGANISM="Chlamydomonas leiostraca, Strain SAG 11-49" /LENGTH=411 /DNA_ID=CAMNT_0049536817 /DNA_START=153 /DNA_END=1388 /DNA_ORIENTATION=+
MTSWIVLEVICPEVGCDSQVRVSRASTVGSLKAEACSELGVLEASVDLYDFFGGQCYACLEDKLGATVANARLMDRQAVLLKGRGGPPVPQPPLDPTAYALPPDLALLFDDGVAVACHRWTLGMASHLLGDVISHLPEPGSSTAAAAGSSGGTLSGPSSSTALGSSTTTTAPAFTPVPPPTPAHRHIPAHHGHSLSAPGSSFVTAVTGPTTPFGSPGHSSGTCHAPRTRSPPPPPAVTDTAVTGAAVSGGCDGGGGTVITEGMAVLRVPGDDRFTWVLALKLLYPPSQMRRPPVTWSNVERILGLADKWALTSVARVCEDFLLQPGTALSPSPGESGYVWQWLVTADRLRMPRVVKKCIQFIQTAKLSAHDPTSFDRAVATAVAQLSPAITAALVSSLIRAHDELRAQVKA